MKTSTRLAARSGLAAATALACLLPWGGAIMAAEEKNVTVTVMLYSGRPDPTFVLDDEQLITRIKSAIAGAERAEGSEKDVIPSILGYKGIVVRSQSEAAGLPSRLSVARGRMAAVDGQTRVLVDKDGAVEKLLLDEAIRKGAIEAKIVERMKSKR
jgi:hypothetical protein